MGIWRCMLVSFRVRWRRRVLRWRRLARDCFRLISWYWRAAGEGGRRRTEWRRGRARRNHCGEAYVEILRASSLLGFARDKSDALRMTDFHLRRLEAAGPSRGRLRVRRQRPLPLPRVKAAARLRLPPVGRAGRLDRRTPKGYHGAGAGVLPTPGGPSGRAIHRTARAVTTVS